MASDIFRDTENVTDHDEGADAVENEEHLLPLDIRVVGLPGRIFPHAVMEDDGSKDEKAEHDDLDEQAAQYDLLANLDLAHTSFPTAHDATSSSLNEEGEDVTNDEDLGHPSHSDDGVICAMGRSHQAPKRHVDCRCEESWSHEDEDRLDDEGYGGFLV